jgi:hypothetical protein
MTRYNPSAATTAWILLLSALAVPPAAAEFFGTVGEFEVALSSDGACEASRGIYFKDADGGTHFAAMSFGMTAESGQLLAMLGLYSNAFDFNPGKSWRGSAKFDGDQHEVVYVADDARMVSTYMAPARVRDIARAHHIDIQVTEGPPIRISLQGSFAATQLVAECYYRHLSRYQSGENPFAEPLQVD